MHLVGKSVFWSQSDCVWQLTFLHVMPLVQISSGPVQSLMILEHLFCRNKIIQIGEPFVLTPGVPADLNPGYQKVQAVWILEKFWKTENRLSQVSVNGGL